MPSSNEIRQQFIDFFVKKHAHTFVVSSEVVPFDDPTLLFANAGMNQFKDVFLGTGSRPYKRAVNTQKCIRAGGKHNDLDDVGKDTYHHTFFEMLGNWSFGDYFKKEAIRWAWELLTEVWGLDKSRLHVTVFEGDAKNNLGADEEAAHFWRTETSVPHNHIHLGNKKDNFWEMGDTGPCGPCTEIHIDLTPDKSGAHLVNQSSAQCIEIWNLVFIQFNRNADGSLSPLPAKHVDTGMGFERVTAILQGKNSNYDTDIFMPIFDAIRNMSGAKSYSGVLENHNDIAYRVIADHIRTLTFAISDGGVPSNEKRGYVLRSVLRRAERYGRQYLGFKEPFLYKLSAIVVQTMGDVFPELKANPEAVAKIIREEEEAFLRTMERGMKLFGEVVDRTKNSGGTMIPGSDVFDLHTTYGFFSDITAQMASEVGLTIDSNGYQTLLEKFKLESGKDRKTFVVSAVNSEIPQCDESSKYSVTQSNAKVIGWIENNTVHNNGVLKEGLEVAVFLDKTCFYAEQGGQVGDSGVIKTASGTFLVENTLKLGVGVLHVGKIDFGSITIGQDAKLLVDPRREDIRRNHTSTHLLNLALRKVLGVHVDQKGSLVDEDKTRFDFSHPQVITKDETRKIENLVNEIIQADLVVDCRVMPLDEAKKIPGVRAVFGEKYPDPVRVVSVVKNDDPSFDGSVEFCGGTHLERTSQAGMFKIIGQESVGKGVRRLTAVTGKNAWIEFQKSSSIVDAIAEKLGCNANNILEKIASLQEELKITKAQIKQGQGNDLIAAMDKLLESAISKGPSKIITGEIPAAPVDQIRQHLDRIRQKAGSCVAVVIWVDEGKVGLMSAVSDDLQKIGIEAGKIISEVAPLVDGKGGGPKGMAQAGGKNPAKVSEALIKAKEIILSKIS